MAKMGEWAGYAPPRDRTVPEQLAEAIENDQPETFDALLPQLEDINTGGGKLFCIAAFADRYPYARKLALAGGDITLARDTMRRHIDSISFTTGNFLVQRKPNIRENAGKLAAAEAALSRLDYWQGQLAASTLLADTLQRLRVMEQRQERTEQMLEDLRAAVAAMTEKPARLDKPVLPPRQEP